MKRTIAVLSLAAVIAVVGLYAPVRAAELERVPSPDQIKNFRIMERVGNALYGIRIEAAKKVEDRPAVKGTSSLEKIAAPQLVSLYEKIRRIGNALWGERKSEQTEDGLPVARELPVVKRADVISPEARACVGAAINVKDEALQARVAVSASELQTAIGSRSACQLAALLATDSQRPKLEACVKTFREAQRRLNESNKQAHKTIWESYRTSLKVCQPASVTAEIGEIMVEDGSESVLESSTDLSVE